MNAWMQTGVEYLYPLHAWRAASKNPAKFDSALDESEEWSGFGAEKPGIRLKG